MTTFFLFLIACGSTPLEYNCADEATCDQACLDDGFNGGEISCVDEECDDLESYAAVAEEECCLEEGCEVDVSLGE